MEYLKSHHGYGFSDREKFLVLLNELRNARDDYPIAVISWEGLFKIKENNFKCMQQIQVFINALKLEFQIYTHFRLFSNKNEENFDRT